MHRLAKLAILTPWLGALLAGAASITVTPNNESTALGTTRQFKATVSGLSSTAVTWSVVGGGSISSSGLYTAPAVGSIATPQTITVTATSQSSPGVSGSATGTLRSPGPKITSISPASFPAGTVTFTINGSGFQSGAQVYIPKSYYAATFVSSTKLTLKVTLTTVGNSYLAVMNPGSMLSNGMVFSVTSSGGGGGGGSNTLTVAPSNPTVATGATQPFTATYNGSPTSSITWSVSGGAAFGTINAAGLYTAPASVPSPATATINATGPSSTTASATVSIIASVIPTLTSAVPNPMPLGVSALTLSGSGFSASSQVTIGGMAVPSSFANGQLTATGYSGPGPTVSVLVSNGGAASAPLLVPVGVPNPRVAPGAARRFLEQAAFGPTPAEAANVQTLGFQGWLNQQYAQPRVSNYQGLGSQGGMPTRFITNAVTNPDQLRQRVAFAYSQIFVVSINKDIWNSTMVPYEELLLQDAFVNFRQLLNDVTLSPAMGEYLDAANNAKGNAAGTVLPNENYAREIMQLFSIGPNWLNPDGTLQLDASGNPLPTYDQNTVANFAKVFTGWTYAPVPPSTTVNWGGYINNPISPMVPYDAEHDTSPKTLLQGVLAPAMTSLPGGQNTQTDLNGALDNIFYHPNVGPFFGRMLIQHLVKSNPSPNYVARVAAAFANNGQGVRGDMTAVISAILNDPEARANDAGGQDQITDGHIQEPALYIAGVIRALNGSANDQNYFSWDLFNMQQDIFNPPTVFNYYSPSYGVPGYYTSPGVNIFGPEFQIYTAATSVYRANFLGGLFSSYSNPVATDGPGTTIDLTAYVNLAGTPALLVSALDLALTHGQMPQAMKTIVTNAVTAENGGNLRRVQTAIYLIAGSSYYNVWH